MMLWMSPPPPEGNHPDFYINYFIFLCSFPTLICIHKLYSLILPYSWISCTVKPYNMYSFVSDFFHMMLCLWNCSSSGYCLWLLADSYCTHRTHSVWLQSFKTCWEKLYGLIIFPLVIFKCSCMFLHILQLSGMIC